jgi:energy-coupling factor transporter ATP-binding protein EcfA2
VLTKLLIKNFKRFGQVDIELGNPVVFIGPNNSGKTAALQALALWDIGVKRWLEKRGGKGASEKKKGVTINRRDLIAVPIPNTNLLWRDLHIRDIQMVDGKPQTKNIRIDILVEGVTEGNEWKCGLEFDYANEESFYCRPLRISEGKDPERMPIPPKETIDIRVAFLPPMSGLFAYETRLFDLGAINVRLGEGRTAEVLRNLCFQITNLDDGEKKWEKVCRRIYDLFRVELEAPQLILDRGEIIMTYRDTSGVRLDLSSSGRGLQQTLLLLAHLTINPGSVLLLDEPDAHLEILRQRQTYQLLTDTAREQRSQIILASHSEVILNEAADRDVVVAFVGKPHRIDDRGSQLLKSLKEIGFDHYYQAEQTGWILYLEGSTDLAILRAFAEILNHPAQKFLERPFVHYVQNRPEKARDHFCGLREAYCGEKDRDLIGFALFDRLEQSLKDTPALKEYMWNRREIENYICSKEALLSYSVDFPHETDPKPDGPLFEAGEKERRKKLCKNALKGWYLDLRYKTPQTHGG